MFHSTRLARPSARFGLVVFALLVAAFLLVYNRSFRVKPASDDWPIVNEIHRGHLQGVGVFFSDSVIQIGYRPLKSVVIWAFGSLSQSIDGRMAWIRVAHLTAAIGYAAVALLWARTAPLGKTGLTAMLAVMLLHPVLPQATASVDGVDTLASAAFLWFGAWFAYRWRNHPLMAVLTVIPCFIIGVGFKENLYALLPLSVGVMLIFPTYRVTATFVALSAALLVFSIGAFALRAVVISSGLASGDEMLRFNPIQTVANAGLFGLALLFFGNSLWVALERTPLAFGVAGAACVMSVLVITLGLWVRARSGARSEADIPSRSGGRWVLFGVFGIVCGSFPAILLYHVSEMYVPPMLLPFALLCGLAADGLAGGRLIVRVGVAALCCAALVTSVLAVRAKVNGLVEVGDRADAQLRQALTQIPPQTRDARVALLFDIRRVDRRGRYAVFKISDEFLLVHEMTFEWYRPDMGLKLSSIVVSDQQEINLDHYDIALAWQNSAREFKRVK